MLVAMVAETSITRTLARAMRAVGSLELLAEYLGVSQEQLEEWLAGRRAPPTSIYVRALDLVASGPFAARPRRRTDGRKK
jgi:DNA-binding transcriptional regulator YiaG